MDGPMDVSDDVFQLIDRATRKARVQKALYIDPLHIFLEYCTTERRLELEKLFQLFYVTINEVVATVKDELVQISRHQNDDELPYIGHDLTERLARAREHAKFSGDIVIGLDSLLTSILESKEIKKVLDILNIDRKEVLDNYESIMTHSKGTSVENPTSPHLEVRSETDLVKVEIQKPSPLVLGRRKLVLKMINMFFLKIRNVIWLVGERGIGKMSVIRSLAQVVVGSNDPDAFTCSIFVVDFKQLVEASEHSILEKVRAIKLESMRFRYTTIIVFQDLDALKNRTTPICLKSIINECVENNTVKLVVTSTYSYYEEIQKSGNLSELVVNKIEVDELNVEDTINVLRSQKKSYEEKYTVVVPDAVLVQIVRATDRYVKSCVQPTKALNTLEKVCSLTCAQYDYTLKKVYENMSGVKEVQYIIALLKEAKLESKLKTNNGLDLELQREKKTLEYLRYNLYRIRKGISTGDLALYNKKEFLRDYNVQKPKNKSNSNSQLKNDMTVRMESEFVARALKLDNVASTESVTVVIADDTGLPLTEIFDKEIDENDSGSRAAKVVNLEEKLKKVIMGQDHAVALICNSIKRMVCGFNSSKRPIGSYLLLGPTGVGKTEICNQLAQHLFQAKENRCQGSKILRINMSEFKEKHTLSKLIGSPPGYIGSQEGGMLTNFVKKNSYSIVLFDEFEKAHPDIHNMLLGLLDYGGLNDGLGNFVDFTNTIIMLTSNVGQKVIIEQTMSSISKQSSTLFGNNDDTEGKHVLDNIAYSTIRAAVDITLKEMFRPELINRFDEVIIFNALSKYELTKIIELQLNKFKQTLVQEKGISLHYSNTSLRQFVDANYDPFYGAREIKRYIERHVVTQISDLIINGKLKAGDEVYMEYAREHYNGNGSSSSCGGINLMRGQFNIHYSAGLEKK